MTFRSHHDTPPWDCQRQKPNLLTSLDIEHHAQRRRQVLPLYQIGALANIQWQVDGTLAIFLDKMAIFAQEGTVIDMTEWLQLYTFDTIGGSSVTV